MYTLSDVISVLDKIDLSNTNAEPGCVYTGPSGGHCIAGQICVELGIDVPEWDDKVGNHTEEVTNPNTDVFLTSKMAKEFYTDAAKFISDCQYYADDPMNILPTWNECVDHALKDIGDKNV